MKQTLLTLLMLLVVLAAQAELRWRQKQAGVVPTQVFREQQVHKSDAILQVRREHAYHTLREHLETAVNLAEVARTERLNGEAITTSRELIACKLEIERFAKKLQGEGLGPVQDFAKQAAQAVASGDFPTIQRHYWWCVTP